MAISLQMSYQQQDELFRDTILFPMSLQGNRPGPSRLLGQPDVHVYNVILEAVLDRPNMYLHEIRELLFENTGIQASITTIYRTLRRLGLTRKQLRRIYMRQNDIRMEL